MRTPFFNTCLGVFQGGGCRAAALAGAYQAAVEQGAHFAQVAGTSAGSIVAALVGAGASPTFVLETLRALDFRRLLQPAERGSNESIFVKLPLWVARKLGPSDVRQIATLLRWGGLYSSSGIEAWIDGVLAKLLPDAKRPICFGDLPVPAYVVATDVQGAKPKVWSTFDTPDDGVAFAVRASCCIPFFFQPVQHGENRYVDGGLLSNLPSFVFADDQSESRPKAARVLAFQLTSEYDSPSVWGPIETARRIGSAMVDGATELQGRLQPDVHVIQIPTPGVKATDFDLMTKDVVDRLVESGRQETTKFMRGALIQTRGGSTDRVACVDEDDVFNALVSLADKTNAVTIVMDTAEWIWRLFPTVLLWLMQPLPVRVVLRTLDATDERARGNELRRRALLEQLGAVVVQADRLPFQGFILNGDNPDSPAAVLYLDRVNDSLPRAMCYVGPEHYDVIKRFYHEALASLGNVQVQIPRPPQLVPYDAERLCGMLKAGVQQYRQAGVNLSIEEVAVDDLMMVVRYVREFKYRQIDRFVSVLESLGYELFAPLGVRLENGSVSVVGPPVVEESGGKFAIIEGNTRLTHCRIAGRQKVRCVVVRGVRQELPSMHCCPN